jgi:hypothetical protein
MHFPVWTRHASPHLNSSHFFFTYYSIIQLLATSRDTLLLLHHLDFVPPKLLRTLQLSCTRRSTNRYRLLGRARLLIVLLHINMPQKVVVIGAGPVGSLAALYAAVRGHDVEIHELRSGTHGQTYYRSHLVLTFLRFTFSRVHEEHISIHQSSTLRTRHQLASTDRIA